MTLYLINKTNTAFLLAVLTLRYGQQTHGGSAAKWQAQAKITNYLWHSIVRSHTSSPGETIKRLPSQRLKAKESVEERSAPLYLQIKRSRNTHGTGCKR